MIGIVVGCCVNCLWQVDDDWFFIVDQYVVFGEVVMYDVGVEYVDDLMNQDGVKLFGDFFVQYYIVELWCWFVVFISYQFYE